jgi:hypothetical protein
MPQYKDNRRVFTLQAATAGIATATGTPFSLGGGNRTLVITWDITAAERDSANETYDVYITTSDGVSSWDLVHFPQVLTTGAKRFVARVLCNSILPQSVTTAAPGVASVESATLAVIAGAANAIKTLAAGTVRHGPIGTSINHELVVAGTIAAGGIAYSISVVEERY